MPIQPGKPKQSPEPQPTKSSLVDTGTVAFVPPPASGWLRREVVMLYIALGLLGIDHLSFLIGFACEWPGYFIMVAVFPPLFGSSRWPLVALSLNWGRRNRWGYALLVFFLLLYVANAIYWWINWSEEERAKLSTAFNSDGAFFFFSSLHMLLHAAYWCAAFYLMIHDVRRSRAIR